MITRANLIRGRTKMTGLTIAQLAQRAGIVRQTLYAHLKDPGKITLAELRAIDMQVHFSDEELVQLVRRRT